MERDFMGLSSKEPLALVKEEIISDGFKEIGFSKGSGIHWPFPNKVSALPHLMSFKVAQEDKTKRTVSESLVSPGLLSLSTTDAFEPSQKPVIAENQKSFNHDRQGGTQSILTAYPVQHDVHHPRELKMFPVSNYPSSISMSNPFLKNHYATTGQNIVGITMKPQLLQGISVTTPQTIRPTIGSVVGVTESCANVSASSAQLTIFYAGTVNVYDDVSPEKAQTIMLLAGNGSSISSNITQPKIQVQDSNSKPVATDASPENNPVSTPPCSRLSSPLSVSSHTGVQSGSGSTSSEEIMAAKTSAAATTPVSKLDSPKLTSPVGSIAATTMIPSAVPQARKASLARFLEKRKERVMSAAPYNLGKTSPEYGA